MKWQATITDVGSEVIDLLKTGHMFDLVIEGKREDMRDFTVHFSGELPYTPIVSGDTFSIGNRDFIVIAVGSQFNEHFKEHGACTVEMSTGLVPSSPYNMIIDDIFDGYNFLKKGSEISVK